MVQAPWTYELPVTGSFAEILDDYEACTADGAHAGIVIGLVERGGERYLLVDGGRLPPFLHRRFAVRWEDVTLVDHDALVVEFAGDRARLQATALALDPALARHDASADAVRVHELPAALARSVVPGVEGPVEGLSTFGVVALTALGVYGLLAIVGVWSARGLSDWEYALLALPLLPVACAFVLAGYRLYREPHVGRHARRVLDRPPGGARVAAS
ncbi:MAG TPA: hypothetical protein VE088_07930 [Gaiellaceae bacterium]|jgi:hypothetical protein|nr:hypothetical protein [Gaiellaceae bacterium]